MIRKTYELINLKKLENNVKKIVNSSKDYKYPHDYPNAYVPQQYLPDNLKNKKYYIPKDKGYEQNIKYVYDKLESIKKTVS